MLVNIKVGDIKTVGVIDTGASVSCIASSLIKDKSKIRTIPEIILKGISKSKISVDSIVSIGFSIEDKIFHMQLLVVKDLSVSLLLGIDFCREHKIIINFAENMISTPKGLVSNFSVPISEEQVSYFYREVREEKDEEKYIQLIQEEIEESDVCRELNVAANLSVEQRQKLELILAENQDRIAWINKQLGRCRHSVLKIDTGNSEPVHQRPYRGSHEQRKIIEEQIKEMLDDGVIESSNSPWASPVVLVKKKDNKWRFCVDYRQLNKIIKLDKYPLPRIDDLLSYLSGAKYFATLDLLSGYWQIPIHDKDKHKTAFITTNGLFQFNVLPFGLSTSGACFQRMIDQVLGNLKYNGVLVYLDDILVVGKTFDEFCINLEKVFHRLRIANLTLNPKKCTFGYGEVEILGHLVREEGISPSISKLEAVRKFPKPRSIKEVRSFIGLASFYRKFIKDFAQIATPLTELTKKSVRYKWGERQERAFELLKNRLCKSPVLNHFDPELESVICVDASDYALGCYLSQKGIDNELHPVFYASRKLSNGEIKYGATEKESLAIVWAVEYFRHFIWGTKFIIMTDCRALKWLMKAKNSSSRLARWALRLQEYNFDVKYKKGTENKVADALSRNPFRELNERDECSELPTYLLEYDTIGNSQKQDAFCMDMVNRISQSRFGLYRGYFLKQDMLYKRSKISGELIDILVVPENIINEIIMEFHDNARNGAHLGIHKTLGRIRSRIWCRRLAKHVERYVKSCQKCQEVKGENRLPIGELYPTSCKRPMERIAIDVMGPLSFANNSHRYIISSIDYATKWAQACSVASVCTEQLCKFVNDEIISRHGIPEEIITDRGSQFTSQMFGTMLRNYGIKHILIPTAHAASNGLIEKFNGTLKKMIICYINNQQDNWVDFLQDVVFSYNTAVQHTTGYSPFKLLYNREPKLIIDTKINFRRQDNLLSQRERDISSRRVKEIVENRVQVQQRRQKKEYDKRHRKETFNLGDYVMVKDFSKTVGKSFNLQPRYKGPYRIIQQVAPSIYMVKSVHNEKQIEVHVEYFKKYYMR